jgi:3-phenylpropionate/trans-cinnamate dioxygenase ferredoxin subunit
MADFVPALKISDLPTDTKKAIVISGKRIMVANVGGKYFAIDDACTHAGCSLGAEGSLEGSVITCGCHGGQFDVTNGQVVSPPPQTPMVVHKVKIEGDTLMVAV